MKLDQTLEYLGLDELPKPGTSTSQKKMACLVERVTGVKDYAIAKNGGIVADIGFVSSVKRIIEFYPEQTKKEKAAPKVDEPAKEETPVIPPIPVVPIVPEPPSEDDSDDEKDEPDADNTEEPIEELTQQQQDVKDLEEIFPPTPEAEPTGEQPTSTRDLMIAFLETQRNKRATLDTKTDLQLADMCKRFGKEF
jgi:hypothetical protein